MDTCPAAADPAAAQPDPVRAGRLIPFWSDDEWHALRRQDCTASTLGGLFGVSSWATPYSEYVEKKGLAQVPKRERPWMTAGRYLEDGIARYAAAEHEWRIATAGEYVDAILLQQAKAGLGQAPVLPAFGAYLRDPDARLGATPDRIILGGEGAPDRPMEVKNVSWQAWKEKWERGEAPVQYWLQANTQCGLGRLAGLGWSSFTIVALVAGSDLRVLDYEFDADAFEIAQTEARRFWADVEAGREPMADCSHPATQDAVRRRYLRSRPERADLTGDDVALQIAEALSEARARENAAKKEADALAAQLLTRIGHYAEADLPRGWSVTAKSQDRKSYTVAATTFRAVKVKPGNDAAAEPPAPEKEIAA